MSSPVVLITGANRGIGFELVRQYAADGWTVYATVRGVRQGAALSQLSGDIRVMLMDVAESPTVRRLVQALGDQPIDVLINNAGVYGPDDQGLAAAFDGEEWSRVLSVNTMGPVRVTSALLEHLRAGRQRKVVSLSSLMGSIGDNGSGGSMYYRSSKAALNAAMKTISLDLKDEGFTVVVVHPGWVRTDMGGLAAPILPPDSAASLRRLIAGLSSGDTGRFFNVDGRELPW